MTWQRLGAAHEAPMKTWEATEASQKYNPSGKLEGWRGTESLGMTREEWDWRAELGKRMEIQIREVSKAR